jgi:hypothetical protein
MNTTPPRKLKFQFKLLITGTYFFCLLMIAVFAYKHPHYNWDILAYMALVIQEDNSDIKQIHEMTYKAAEENIPAIDYEHLIMGEHRKNLSTDPTAFFKTLPLYAVKPMYLKMVSLFHKAGFSLPVSTVLPSIVFYILLGLLLFYWLLKYLKIIWAFAVGISIMLSSFMVFMPRLSSPDCMSAFLLLSAFYFIIQKPSLKWMFLFLLLSVFARLDNIIPCFFILSFLFFTRQWQKEIKPKYYLLMLFVIAACYFGIIAITMKPFGWNIFYYPTYARYMNLSHSFDASFSIKNYIALVFSQITTAVVFYHFIFFMLFVLLILYSPNFKYRNVTLDQSFTVLLVVIILFRFILYPDLSDRFNIAYYLCFLIIFIKKYVGIISSLKALPLAKD